MQFMIDYQSRYPTQVTETFRALMKGLIHF